MKDGFNARFAAGLNKALTDSGVSLGGSALAYVADRMADVVLNEVGFIITDPAELNKAKKDLTDKAAARKEAEAKVAADAAAKAKDLADAEAFRKAQQSVDAEAFAKAFAAIQAQKPVAPVPPPTPVPPVPATPTPVAPGTK